MKKKETFTEKCLFWLSVSAIILIVAELVMLFVVQPIAGWCSAEAQQIVIIIMQSLGWPLAVVAGLLFCFSVVHLSKGNKKQVC